MTVSFSVKNVPDEVADRLRERAQRNRRSLQHELLVILEESVLPTRLNVGELRREIKALAFSTPDESTEILRGLRDSR